MSYVDDISKDWEDRLVHGEVETRSGCTLRVMIPELATKPKQFDMSKQQTGEHLIMAEYEKAKDFVLEKKGEDVTIAFIGERNTGKTSCRKFIVSECLQEIAEKPEEIDQFLSKFDFVLECMLHAMTTANREESLGTYITRFITSNGKLKTLDVNAMHINRSFLSKRHGCEDNRNYHVYYGILFALDGVKDDSGFIESLRLNRKAHYRILGNIQNMSEQTIKRYQTKFDDMQSAFDTMNLDGKVGRDIVRSFASVLHIGNIDFDADAHGNARIRGSSVDALNAASTLLGLPDPKLLTAFLCKSKVSPSGVRTVNRKTLIKEAESRRDAFMQSLHHGILQFVLDSANRKLNEMCRTHCHEIPPLGAEDKTISFLDLRSFDGDRLTDCGLEDLTELIMRESVEMRFLLDMQDTASSHTIEAQSLPYIIGKDVTVMSLVEDTCRLESLDGQTQKYLLRQISDHFKSNEFLKITGSNRMLMTFPNMRLNCTVNLNRLVGENFTSLRKEVVEALRTSENSIAAYSFSAPLWTLPGDTDHHAWAKSHAFVSSLFANDLKKVMNLLNVDHRCYIRCFRLFDDDLTASSRRKKIDDMDRVRRQVRSSSFDVWDQGVFDSEMTLEQLFNLLVEGDTKMKEDGEPKSVMSQMDIRQAINESMQQHGMSSPFTKIGFSEDEKCLIPPMLMTKILRWRNRSKNLSSSIVPDVSKNKAAMEAKESSVIVSDVEDEDKNEDGSEATFIIVKEQLSCEMESRGLKQEKEEKEEDHDHDHDVIMDDSTNEENVEECPDPNVVSDSASPILTSKSVAKEDERSEKDSLHVDDEDCIEREPLPSSLPSTSRSDDRSWRECYPSPISVGYSRIPVQTPDRKDLTFSAFSDRSSLDMGRIKKRLDFFSPDESHEKRVDTMDLPNHEQILADAAAAIIWLSTRREYESVSNLSAFLVQFERAQEEEERKAIIEKQVIPLLDSLPVSFSKMPRSTLSRSEEGSQMGSETFRSDAIRPEIGILSGGSYAQISRLHELAEFLSNPDEVRKITTDLCREFLKLSRERIMHELQVSYHYQQPVLMQRIVRVLALISANEPKVPGFSTLMVTYGINEALIHMLARDFGNKELQLLIALYFKTSIEMPENREWFGLGNGVRALLKRLAMCVNLSGDALSCKEDHLIAYCILKIIHVLAKEGIIQNVLRGSVSLQTEDRHYLPKLLSGVLGSFHEEGYQILAIRIIAFVFKIYVERNMDMFVDSGIFMRIVQMLTVESSDVVVVASEAIIRMLEFRPDIDMFLNGIVDIMIHRIIESSSSKAFSRFVVSFGRILRHSKRANERLKILLDEMSYATIIRFSLDETDENLRAFFAWKNAFCAHGNDEQKKTLLVQCELEMRTLFPPEKEEERLSQSPSMSARSSRRKSSLPKMSVTGKNVHGTVQEEGSDVLRKEKSQSHLRSMTMGSPRARPFSGRKPPPAATKPYSSLPSYN